MTERLLRPTGFPFLDDALGPPAGVLAFAHRGGALNPQLPDLENTLPAFAAAVAQGYTHLETDVHATRDGVLLAFHDEVLDRVTGGTGPIRELGYAELAEVRVAGHEPIPTLAELFERFPETRINIDVKAADAVEPLARFLLDNELNDRALVGSFSARRLTHFRRLVKGRVPTSASPWEVACFRVLPSHRLARLLARGRFSVFQVPHRHGRLRIVTPGFVRRAHAAGMQVHVWTVDTPEEMHELIDRGIDGLITDRTDILRATLRSRGLWLGGDEHE